MNGMPCIAQLVELSKIIDTIFALCKTLPDGPSAFQSLFGLAVHQGVLDPSQKELDRLMDSY